MPIGQPWFRRTGAQMLMAGFDAKFVVATSQVLDEGMTTDHRRSSPIGSQPTHRAKPRLEPPVIPLDAIVGVLLRVVEDIGEQFVDDVQ